MGENSNPFIDDENNENKDIEKDIENNAEEQQNSDENENNENIEQAQDENSQYKEKYEQLDNKYLRLAADFDNYRKRTAQEKEDLSTYTTIELLKKIVPVLDTFDRAKEHLKDIDNCETVKESYEVAYKQLIDTLKKIGLSEIDALGADFNPTEHEAITQVPTDKYEPDKVALVAQKGYKLNDKVVRAALVGVAKEKEEE